VPCQGGFPGGSVVKNPPANTGDVGFRKIPWRWKWRLTPEFLPGKSHGQRRLVGYSWWVTKNWIQLRDWVCYVRKLSKFVQFHIFFFFFLLQQAVLNFLESLVSSEAGNCVRSPANFCLSGQVVNCILRILSYWSVISSCDMLQSTGFPSQEIESRCFFLSFQSAQLCLLCYISIS